MYIVEGFVAASIIIILSIFYSIIKLLIFSLVLKKAGFSRWWALLMAIPNLNLALIWVFAFIKWPAESNA